MQDGAADAQAPVVGMGLDVLEADEALAPEEAEVADEPPAVPGRPPGALSPFDGAPDRTRLAFDVVAVVARPVRIDHEGRLDEGGPVAVRDEGPYGIAIGEVDGRLRRSGREHVVDVELEARLDERGGVSRLALGRVHEEDAMAAFAIGGEFRGEARHPAFKVAGAGGRGQREAVAIPVVGDRRSLEAEAVAPVLDLAVKAVDHEAGAQGEGTDMHDGSLQGA